MSAQILLLDKDFRHAQFIRSGLEKEGFTVMQTSHVIDAKAHLRDYPIKLAIVDPDFGNQENGMDFIRYTRDYYPDTRMIILSEKATVVDRVLGIEMGADDYLTKPADVREITARLRRLLSRMNSYFRHQDNNRIKFSGFMLDRSHRHLVWEITQERVTLTSREYDLLLCLIEHGNRVVDRNSISSVVCGRPIQALDRSVDVAISNLRKKLRCYNTADNLIRSVRGSGYCFSIRYE
ncbi:MAG: response regulator transcription factor [Ferrovum sp.]|nr:response regulator transcription factor [Ferrovum sp.]